MSVPTKPTETLTWAESGSPPSAPGSNLPSEPSAGVKASGYGFQEPLPHDEYNWVMRTLNRWLKWVTEKMDLHVHDGGTNPESVSKVHLKNHINYGTNGFFEVTQDTGTVHEITHGGGATTKRLISGNFNGATLNLSGNATISGTLVSSRVPRGVARVKGDDGTFYSNSGFDPGPTRASAGDYVLAFDGLNPTLSKIVVEVTLADTIKTNFTVQAKPIDSFGTRVILVKTRDSAGVLNDCDFSITGYVLP